MRGTQRIMRRAAAFLAVTAVTALALSACSSSGGPTDHPTLSDKPVTLSFTWWGNDARTVITNNVIKAFEKKYPNITIEPQGADNTVYWDKLATETAAGNTPDIIQMDELYIATYAERGVLLDLNSLSDQLSLKDFPKTALQTGQIDGKTYGLVNGQNTAAIFVNPALLEQAGVAMPDDKTWTWDDLAKDAAAVTKASGGKVYGLQSWGYDTLFLSTWVRDQGDSLYNAKGDVTVKTKTMTSYFQYMVDLQSSGAIGSASAVAENAAGSDSATFIATNKATFAVEPSNQLTVLSSASGSDLKILRVPTASGTENGSAWYRASQFWSASSKTKHPAEVGLFLNFLANSETAADFLLTERGVPANTTMAAYIAPKLQATDKAQVSFLDSISTIVGTPPVITPAGGSAFRDLSKQYMESVAFKKMTPEQAAAGFIKDLKDAITKAK